MQPLKRKIYRQITWGKVPFSCFYWASYFLINYLKIQCFTKRLSSGKNREKYKISTEDIVNLMHTSSVLVPFNLIVGLI